MPLEVTGLREHTQAQRGHLAGGSPNLVQLHDLVGDHHEDQGEAAQEPRQQRHVLQAKVDVAVPVRPQLQVHCCLDHLPQQPAGGGSPASAGSLASFPAFLSRNSLRAPFNLWPQARPQITAPLQPLPCSHPPSQKDSHHGHGHRPPEVCQGALSPQGLGAMHVGDGDEDWRKWGQWWVSDFSRPEAWSPGCLTSPGEPLTSVQDGQGGGELLSRQQPVGEVVKPGWSRVGVAAKARCGLSFSSGPRGGKPGRGCQDGTHLGSMTEEQLVRLRTRELSQKLCSVKPKQMRHELMVRLNLSKKQSRK